ncbi:MAG: helix-turn-helix domain-containing protein [Pseudomonadota bacterium]
MSSPDELDVSVDAISTGPTPGQKLRLAREARGLSLDDVTAETNLSPKYLQALEADDYAALPGLAFARGYARRYAQLVHLDGSALIAEMDLLAAAQGITVPASLSASSSSMQRASIGISQVATRKASDMPSSLSKAMTGLKQVNMAQLLSLGSLALLLLLLLGTLFWQSNDDSNTEPMADNGVIDIDADMAQQAPPDVSVPAVPVPVATVEPAASEELPATDVPDEAVVLPTPGTVAAPAAALPAVAAPASSVAVPAPVAAPVVAKAPPAVPVVVAPGTAALAAKPAAAAPVVIPVTATPAPAPVPKAASVPPGIDSLNFSFTGKSWISVRDATGQELVYGLKNAGQAVTVTGQAPFSINIGNVNVTTLSRNGRAVNLKQYARGEIASFRLAPSAAPKP